MTKPVLAVGIVDVAVEAVEAEEAAVKEGGRAAELESMDANRLKPAILSAAIDEFVRDV